jgi:hypothetical protein
MFMERTFRLTGIAAAVAMLAVATVMLVIANRILNPAPIPAVGMIAGGLLAFYVRDRLRWMAMGAVAGWALGISVHTYSHFAEGRVTSGSELVSHVGVNAGLGFVVGAGVLGIVLCLEWFLTKVPSRRSMMP